LPFGDAERLRMHARHEAYGVLALGQTIVDKKIKWNDAIQNS